TGDDARDDAGEGRRRWPRLPLLLSSPSRTLLLPHPLVRCLVEANRSFQALLAPV
ncbi:hypothetical protein U1Q18_025818, partial [Sarracenia purpurea var. burkii]